MKATTVKLGEELKSRVHALAEHQRRTAHWIMIEAISEYVEREEKRQAFHDSTQQAWDKYQASQLHLTQDEVESWLDTWGQDHEQGAPSCHK